MPWGLELHVSTALIGASAASMHDHLHATQAHFLV